MLDGRNFVYYNYFRYLRNINSKILWRIKLMGNSYGKASMPNKDFDNAGDVLGGISNTDNFKTLSVLL